jgi:dienelactone hydrolase
MAGVKHAKPALRLSRFVFATVVILASCNARPPADTPWTRWADIELDSLADLSIPALRSRPYGSTIQPEAEIEQTSGNPAFIGSYDSDGNRIFTRIDIPASPPPDEGYPVVIFVHGWVGREAAPSYSFSYPEDSVYRRIVERYVRDGFLVLSPALRGHGSVNGVAAEGIEFLDAWDNGSYLSPMFYAIDVLNLLEGIVSLEQVDWQEWGLQNKVVIDLGRISISGHSQGGDSALTALAVSGEGSTIRNALASGSIFSGCYGPRFEQAGIYGPMASTLEAFMSGDGSWTGSATGRNGEVNPNFVFAWPSDWIGTMDTTSDEWTWQADTWSTPTVAEALNNKYTEMYQAVNRQVADITDARFEIGVDDTGKAGVVHDPRIMQAMQQIGGYGFEEFLTEPLHFHHSDRDYYSIPRWNSELAARINAAGGRARDFTYSGNTHSLLVSKHGWSSQGEVVEGLGYMIERDLALFSGADSVGGPGPDDLTSIASLRRYAATMKNQFRLEYEREALDGVQRRVVSFSADGLKQYALVMDPPGQPPEEGWPVLLMNHGYHPDPPNNGRIEDGSTDRPGNYYRGLPLAFAKAGFLVVVPDYRGHNISEGLEYTKMPNAHFWYTRDVIAAFRALESLPGADTREVFMWGHSMGGSITLRALMALGDEVRGASIWSSSPVTGADDPGYALAEIKTPLNIHHSVGDGSTPFSTSQLAYAEMSARGQTVHFHQYPGNDHLFTDGELLQAINEDIAFFQSFMQVY